MDEIVKQALAKWPNVPHCYGWLALDARGAWRMRDERAQKANLPGEKIYHPALLGFIIRNYASDEQHRWYFQNGPQRVYVNLEATPYIARTDPQQGFTLQTGTVLDQPDAAWMGPAGNLVLRQGDRLAQVDDRDMAQCLEMMTIDGAPLQDDSLLGWLANGTGKLSLHCKEITLVVQHLPEGGSLAGFFGFADTPQP